MYDKLIFIFIYTKESKIFVQLQAIERQILCMTMSKVARAN